MTVIYKVVCNLDSIKCSEILSFYDVNYCSIEESLLNYSLVDKTFNDYCITFANKNLDIIIKWQNIENEILSITPMISDEDISLSQIVYNMKDGFRFFKPYLLSQEQYYGSLSFQQECKLYYDVIHYLVECSTKDFNKFMNEYIELNNALGQQETI